MNMHARNVKRGGLLLIGITLFIWRCISSAESSTDRADLLNLSGRNQDRLLHFLRPVLNATTGAGRLYVRSKCLGDSGNLLVFPSIEVKSGIKGTADFAAIRDALAKNKGVTVAARRSGLITIWIGGVSNDLLSTEIRELQLGARQRYNYYEAIKAIIGAKEVQAKMRELQMTEFTSFASYPILNPDPKLRHLPASMAHLTMDEALDRVALEFGGLVTYRECKGPNPARLFSVDFDAISNSAFKKSP